MKIWLLALSASQLALSCAAPQRSRLYFPGNAWAVQICPSPPSTLISTPVMYDASWDARNATAPATSSGCPNRFMWTFATISLANPSMASFGSPVLPKIGVTIGQPLNLGVAFA